MSLLLPSQTFFTPTKQFMEFLQLFKDYRIIDCGTGMGEMIHHGKQYGLDINGIDICTREGQHPDVQRVNALDITWQENMLALICRPDHSGWVLELGNKIRENNGIGIYVSKSYNYTRDVGPLWARKIMSRAGEEGEVAYMISHTSRYWQIVKQFNL